MKKSNKKIGNTTEEMLMKKLQEEGYWCHLFSYNRNGQPCDVIAMKNNKVFLMDVKHCETKDFYFYRIEDNQRNCFNYAKECGNLASCGFAIYDEQDKIFKWLSWAMVITAPVASCKINIDYLVDLDVIL